MSEQAAYRVTRGHLKASLTKLKTYAENIPANKTIEDIEIRLERLEEITREFRKVDTALAIVGDESENDSFEDKYMEVKAILRATLNAKRSESCQDTTQQSNHLDTTIRTLIEQQTAIIEGLAHNTTSASQASTARQIARLPKIELPSFSGDYKDWPSFKDLFTSCVGNRLELSNATKLQFLKGALKGEAASVIKHLEITDLNYIEAWDKLVRRYDKKRQIISSYIKTFVNQPPINLSTHGIATQLRRIADTSDQIIRGIDVQGSSARSRDPWLIHLILNKLDLETKREWAEDSSSESYPTFKSFIEFLNKRCDALETCEVMKKQNNGNQVKSLNINTVTCVKCNSHHHLFKCPEYKGLTVADKRNLVSKHSLCFNCLNHGHVAQKCNSKNRCHHCNQLHHSSLHIQGQVSKGSIPVGHQSETYNPNRNQLNLYQACSNQTSEGIPKTTSSSHSEDQNTKTQLHLSTFTSTNNFCDITILPTALVYACDSAGRLKLCRALLDSGSQASFISEDCVRRLSLQRETAKIIVRGLSATKSLTTKGKVSLSLSSRTKPENTVEFSAYILDKLTSPQPATSFKLNNWTVFQDYALADPTFNTSQKIDIIIGADYFFKILQDGQVTISSEVPQLQNTVFGYIIAGQMPTQGNKTETVSFHLNITDIESSLRKFWEVEEPPQERIHLTEEEMYCESFFVQNLTVDPVTNRYMVRLPFKRNNDQLGQSIHVATSCFNALERKFSNNRHLYDEYKNFMAEYEKLGHMEPIPKDEQHTTHSHVYLPHHAVFKPSSTTTKVRVVFNGSSPTSTGISLNQKLIAGPKVQRDLIPILLSFRSFKVAMVGDIEKMYRQVLVHPKDRTYQRIIWRTHEALPLNQLWLTTVTYGTSAAPYLATRALKQLTIEFANQYPLAEKALNNNFYIDDFLGGAHDENEAIKLYEELTQLLQIRGFLLRKWSSNSTSFMKHVQPDYQANNAVRIDEHPGSLKVLGLKWFPDEDCFSFDIILSPDVTPTKRNILSESSKVFDPLGLIAPVTILFKIILQQLWLGKFEWDETCNTIGEKWLKLREELIHLQHLRIPRYININDSKIQLHGFADASEAAYAAVVYCRSENKRGEILVRIVTAKTKVSPIKQLSIPRLELCAATLLAKLMSFVQSTLELDINNCFAWTDSSVVLSWLSSHPRKWKSFVGNRTSVILSVLPRPQWNYVESSQNPADIASRGMRPTKILQSSLWWSGPSWLKDNWLSYASRKNSVVQNFDTDTERRSQYKDVFFATTENKTLSLLFEKFSKFTKIIRIICRCFQFVRFSKSAEKGLEVNEINTTDIDKAYRSLILWVQAESFPHEIKTLTSSSAVNSSSHLSSLVPFIDESGILRVGGRLGHSSLSYNTKHPVILPKDHIFVTYLIKHLHEQHLHAGLSLLLSIIRQRYWILSCRNAVKTIINKCITCVKQRATTSQQLMAHLPKPRVGLNRAFECVGVDYAGPLLLLNRRGRGAKTTKGYIVLFVCFSTRAIHLELAGDLSSETFIACFKRFSSRRGLPSVLYSDNGTNFVGAHKYSNNLHDVIKTFIKNERMSEFLLSNKIKWEFNPPAAPHFGGLWEAGVKSVKSILRRTIGDTKLTYEEMNTLLIQIEGLLNSRPLQPTSDDLSSLDVLTPSHFLIGQPITLLPEPPLNQSISLHERWRLIQNMHLHFWKRWHTEYLTMMQQRPKWQGIRPNLQIGDLVVIKDKNLLPAKWTIGRVTRTYPGRDGLVRVVTLQTATGELERPCVKLVRLPIDSDG